MPISIVARCRRLGITEPGDMRVKKWLASLGPFQTRRRFPHPVARPDSSKDTYRAKYPQRVRRRILTERFGNQELRWSSRWLLAQLGAGLSSASILLPVFS